MLLLVLAHRNVGGVIAEDIGRHEHRVGIEADRCRFLVLAGLFLELRHAVEPADPADAAEDPGELGVLGHLALVEDDALLRIESAGEIGGGDVDDGPAQLFRVLPHGDGVHVHHAIDALVGVLHVDPVQHGAQIVAEMQVAGRLHAGKDARNELGH